MVTTPVNFFAISLLAVTFGWAPVEPTESAAAKSALPSDEGGTAGYEYHVRVSPTDLEDLRAGRVDSLSSHLPSDIGPIERVRITFGEGPAPRESTAADRKASEPASEAQRYVVAKPATPEWGPVPKRHVAYQNPNPMTLEQGFQDAANSFGVEGQQAEEWVRRQAQEMTDTAVDSGVQLAQAYVAPPPANGGNPYGSRPPQNGVNTGPNYGATNSYGVNDTVTPPAPTGRSTPQPTGQPNYGTNAPAQYNTSTTPNYNTDPYGAPNNGATGSTQLALPPPPGTTTPVPRSNTNNGFERNPYTTSAPQGPQLANPQGNRVLESFASDSGQYGPAGRSNVTPVQQGQAYGGSNPAGGAGQPYGAGYQSRDEVWNDARGGEAVYAPNRNPSTFPNRKPIDPPPLVDSRDRGASPNTVLTDYERRSTDSSAGDSWLNPGQKGSGDPSRESNFAGLDSEQRKTVVVSESRYFETLMIVILCAVTFYTWTAYMDIRNKYRAALRGTPTAGGLAA